MHDGPNLLSSLIGSFNGTQVPQFLFSSSNFLYLLFTTDNSRSNSGFKIFYEGEIILLLPACTAEHKLDELWMQNFLEQYKDIRKLSINFKFDTVCQINETN